MKPGECDGSEWWEFKTIPAMLILPALISSFLALLTLMIAHSGTFVPQWHQYTANWPQIVGTMALFLFAQIIGYIAGKVSTSL